MKTMNLLGELVSHHEWGTGTIVSQTTLNNQTYYIVAFAKHEKKFNPAAFRSHLICQNEVKQREMNVYLDSIQPLAPTKPSSPIQPIPLNEKKDKKRRLQGSRDNDCNLAIKCTFCDGGSTKSTIGFNGVCSDMMIINNIEKKPHVWCSQPDCDCNQYLEGQISRKELDGLCTGDGFVCYESQMLRNWTVMGGTHHNGDRDGETIPFKRTKPNTLCVMTTRNPQDTEADRCIFGVYLIISADPGDEWTWGSAEAHPKYRLALTPSEASHMLFWKYYFNSINSDNPRWGTGLHRYQSDVQCAQILRDIVEIKSGTTDDDLAREFFTHYCNLTEIDPDTLPLPNGALYQ